MELRKYAETLIFYTSLIPEVIGGLACEAAIWVDKQVDTAMDVWGDE